MAIFFGLKSLAILLLPVIFVLFFRYSEFPIHLFVLALPFMTYMFWNSKTILNYSMAIVVIFIWIASKLLKPLARFETRPFLIWFPVAFICLMLFSSMHGGLTKDEISAIIRFPILFVMIAVIYDSLTPRRYLLMIAALTIPLLVCLYYVILDFRTASGLIDLMFLYRLKPGGFFDNSNNYASAIIGVLPAWLALGVWVRENRWLRIIAGLVSALLIMGLMMSNARASMVGFAAVALFFSIWMKKVKYFILMVLIISAIVIASPVFRTVAAIALRADAGASNRTMIWGETLKMIDENKLFGVGIGNYTESYLPRFDTVGERNVAGKMMSTAHNFALTKTAELGLLAIPLIFMIYFMPVRTGIRCLRKFKKPEDRIVIYGIFGGIIAIFFRSIFEGNNIITEGSFYPDIIFWILFSLLLKIETMNQEETIAPNFISARFHE